MTLLIALCGRPRPSFRGFTCRGCGAPIAMEKDVLSVMGRPVQATYLNPLGTPCKIVTVAEAGNLEGARVATEEHTWFEGYAWRPVVCVSCRLHLGWRYEAVRPGLEPPAFYGLLVGAVLRPGEPGRDM